MGKSILFISFLSLLAFLAFVITFSFKNCHQGRRENFNLVEVPLKEVNKFPIIPYTTLPNPPCTGIPTNEIIMNPNRTSIPIEIFPMNSLEECASVCNILRPTIEEGMGACSQYCMERFGPKPVIDPEYEPPQCN